MALEIYTSDYIQRYINVREGETKLGQRVQTIGSTDIAEIAKSNARYVVLGIPEDTGVRANYGVGGTASLWEPALKALLNVQSIDTLTGEEILVLGRFDFAKADTDVDALRAEVEKIDEAVYPVIRQIAAAGKIPVVIGGGHNNAYPLLKGTSLALNKKINCINMDAHSDYRQMEGRHSGNGFRYAKHEGYMDKYAIVGLHQNYNAQNLIDEMNADPSIWFRYYEDIFLNGDGGLLPWVKEAVRHTSGAPTGIELDLDCIAGVLSSAATPCGISTLQARQYVHYCAQFADVAYMHITEGAVRMDDGRQDASAAKLVAYLITDFIKAYNSKD